MCISPFPVVNRKASMECLEGQRDRKLFKVRARKCKRCLIKQENIKDAEEKA